MTPADYRRKLLALLPRLDRMLAEAEAVLKEPGDTELLPRAEELRELIVEMQASVEQKIDRLTT